MHVLLVEDDPLLGETIEEYLKENNITVKWIQDDREIDDIFDLNQFDVIVLDLMLKYRKGEEILRI